MHPPLRRSGDTSQVPRWGVIAVYALAILVGFGLAWPSWREPAEPSSGSAVPASGPAAPTNDSALPPARAVAQDRVPPTRAVAEAPVDLRDLPIAQGFGLETAREPDGTFVGYRIVGRSTDPRFREGDVIVTVQGHPVEDSAAGSDRLSTAIQDPNAHIGVRRGPASQ